MYTADSGQSVQSANKGTKLPFVVFMYLVAIVLPVKFDIGPLSISGPRLILLFLFVPLFVNLLRGKYGRLLWTDALFFLHILWVIICLFKNNPNQTIQFGGSLSLEFFGGYLLARAYIRDHFTFLALIRVLVIITICTLPLAIYEAQTGKPLFIELLRNLPGIRTDSNVAQPARLGLERAQTVFAHPIHYGIFSCASFSFLFVALKGKIPTFQRYFFSVLVCLCVFFSLSSGALLPLLLQMALIFWAFVFKPGYTRWLILVGLLITLYIAIDLLSNRTPLRVFMTYATFSSHNAYWRTLIFEHGIANVWLNPIFGLGLNDWIRPWWIGSSVDNFWLLMAMSYGIPGFLFIALGFLIALINIGLRKFQSSHEISRIRLAWIFTFIGIAFALSTVHIWSNVYSFVFFMFGAGMWLWTYDLSHTANNDDENPHVGTTSMFRRTGHTFPITAEALEDTSPKLKFTRFSKKN